MMQTEFSTIVNTEESREILSVIGNTIKIIIDGKETNNAYSIFELTVPPTVGPGIHIDTAWDEWWLVIEGTFTFTLNGERKELSAGSFAYGPKGIPHSFKNETNTTGKLLMVTQPSGLEKFFRNIHQLSLNGRPDKETFVKIMRLHKIEPA